LEYFVLIPTRKFKFKEYITIIIDVLFLLKNLIPIEEK